MAELSILIVCGAGYVSGKEIMTLELGKGLAEHGHSISFITSSWNNGDFVNRLKRLGLHSFVLPIGFISATLTKACLAMTGEQVWRWPSLLYGYWRVLHRVKPQKIIHTNWHHLLLLLPFLRRKSDLFWLHEVVPNLPQYRRVFGWFERRIEAFICVSNAVAQSLRQIGICEDNIRVVHNGLTDPAGPLPRLESNCKQFRIGIVGQVIPFKGHSDLLDACGMVRRRHSNIELHIFGTGDVPFRKELQRKAEELGLAPFVIWHEFVNDRARIYGALDVCVIPSRGEEALGLTAIEAGFFALPVIASRRGGLPEIVQHGVNGLLVGAQRPIEISEAICRLIEEPSCRLALAANARVRAMSIFGSDRFLMDFQKLLGARC